MRDDADPLADLIELQPAWVKTFDLPGGDGAYWTIFPNSDSVEIRAEVVQPTVNVWSLGVWYWPEALAVVLALLVLLTGRWWWLARRGKEPRCRKCSYELTSLKSEACPECGTALTQRNRVTGLRSRWRMAIAPAALLLIGAAWWFGESHVPRHGWLSEKVQWHWAVHRDSTGSPGHWGLDYHEWYHLHGHERFDGLTLSVDTGGFTRWTMKSRAIDDYSEDRYDLDISQFTQAWGRFADSDALWQFDADSRTMHVTRPHGERMAHAVTMPEGELAIWDGYFHLFDEDTLNGVDYPFLPDPSGDGWFTVTNNSLVHHQNSTGRVTEFIRLLDDDEDYSWVLIPVRDRPFALAAVDDWDVDHGVVIDLAERRVVTDIEEWPTFIHGWGSTAIVEDDQGALFRDQRITDLSKFADTIYRYGARPKELTRDRRYFLMCVVEVKTLVAADLRQGRWTHRFMIPKTKAEAQVKMMTSGPSETSVNVVLQAGDQLILAVYELPNAE